MIKKAIIITSVFMSIGILAYMLFFSSEEPRIYDICIQKVLEKYADTDYPSRLVVVTMRESGFLEEINSNYKDQTSPKALFNLRKLRIAQLDQLEEDTYRGFVTVNNKSINLNIRAKRPRCRSVLESKSELKTRWPDPIPAGYQSGNNKTEQKEFKYYRQLNGIFTLSRIGYNSARNQALLCVGEFGISCQTYFLLSKKNNNQWQIIGFSEYYFNG